MRNAPWVTCSRPDRVCAIRKSSSRPDGARIVALVNIARSRTARPRRRSGKRFPRNLSNFRPLSPQWAQAKPRRLLQALPVASIPRTRRALRSTTTPQPSFGRPSRTRQDEFCGSWKLYGLTHALAASRMPDGFGAEGEAPNQAWRPSPRGRMGRGFRSFPTQRRFSTHRGSSPR